MNTTSDKEPSLEEAHRETREAVEAARAALGYTQPNPEADEVIDFAAVDEDGQRCPYTLPFFPRGVIETVDRAALLARRYPEALLSESPRAVLDLMLGTATR